MEERILVVDDEKDICDILKFNLENEGYRVDVAYSGEEALDKINDVHNLIILDVMMGGVSGFKIADMLRKSENFVPIIFLTAKIPKMTCLQVSPWGAMIILQSLFR